MGVPGLGAPPVERHVGHVVEELSRRQAVAQASQRVLQRGVGERLVVQRLSTSRDICYMDKYFICSQFPSCLGKHVKELVLAFIRWSLTVGTSTQVERILKY